jgi:hypothetical protein
MLLGRTHPGCGYVRDVSSQLSNLHASGATRVPQQIMSLHDEPLVILGTFRSGTSAMATAYSLLGVYFGQEKDFQPADDFNPGGYWELRDMQVLNAKILGVYGTNFYQIDRLPEDWRSVPGSTAMVSEIRSLLRGKFSGQRFGWKEPSTSILLPLYKEAMQAEGIKNPIYTIAVRHPLSVAASQNKRQSQWGYQEAREAEGVVAVEDRTVGLWTHYTLSSLRESKGATRQLISYEGFLQEPRRYLEWTAAKMCEPKPTAEQMEAAVASVRPDWSHSKYSLDDLKPYSDVVVGTYDLCLRADKDPEGLTAGKYDAEIDRLWEEWITWNKMIRPILLPAGQITFSWREPDGRQNGNAQRFSPTGAWQTINVSLNASPGTEVYIDPYQMPCQIWIKKATWRVGGQDRRAQLQPGPNGVLDDVYGTKRLTLFGPGALMGQIPPGHGEVEFEMEFLVQAGQVILSDIISTLRGKLDQIRRAAGPQAPYGVRRL